MNEIRRAWYKSNPDKILALRQNQDKAKQAEHVRKWVKLNPERRRQHLLANQHKRRGAPGDGFTASDVERLLVAQKYKCVACKVSVKAKRHVDHIMPLSKGGRNDVGNIQILCPSCNLKKRARDPIEFMQSLGRLL